MNGPRTSGNPGGDLRQKPIIGEGEGNQTLVISLEGCCDLNDFQARLTKSARFRGFEPKPIIRPVRRPESAPERREAAP
jgi:hypothetical protein